ncbi:MAG: CHAT domain-containing protein [Myxococcales bacterium]|nr:CHAT domain-containing protein [Myxococcales bacterium]
MTGQLDLSVRVIAAGASWRIDYQLSRPDGTTRAFRASQAALPPNQPGALFRWLLQASAQDAQGAPVDPWQAAQPTRKAPLCVLLTTDHPQIHSLHWERMRDPATGLWIGVHPNTRFARLVQSGFGQAPPRREALVVTTLTAAEVTGTFDQPLAPIPADFGAQALAATPWQSTAGPPVADTSSLRQHLRAAPDVLLLVSHAGAVAPEAGNVADQPKALYLGAEKITAAELATTLENQASRPTLICLTGCTTAADGRIPGFGERLVSAGTPAALTFHGTVPQTLAVRFLKHFLGEAYRSGDLLRAAQVARAALFDKMEAAALPVLHVDRERPRLWAAPPPAEVAPISRRSVAAAATAFLLVAYTLVFAQSSILNVTLPGHLAIAVSALVPIAVGTWLGLPSPSNTSARLNRAIAITGLLGLASGSVAFTVPTVHAESGGTYVVGRALTPTGERARAKALSKGQAPEPRALLAWGPPEQLWSDVPQQRQRLSAALFGLVATLASLAAFLVLRLWPTQRKAHP